MINRYFAKVSTALGFFYLELGQRKAERLGVDLLIWNLRFQLRDQSGVGMFGQSIWKKKEIRTIFLT
ncbi:MAG: hypothetical protein A2X86_15515 [Bdellovibrionales bacterium GWA2_49_15]|nr:MAG: hypothetical protein A2X86_15515 [Bdellovibrionales bacterium GWA2_49_15]HAZ14538.1 hypothetical protein [Bdellovibrionales bacterium]